MTQQTIYLPKLGESITRGTVVSWLKEENDPVLIDEPLCEVSTDKMTTEIPSPFAGILKKRIPLAGETVDVGSPIAILEVEGPGEGKEKNIAKENGSERKECIREFFSPAVLRLAKEQGVSLELLRTISGTGDLGRVTRKDVENFLKLHHSENRCHSACATLQESPTPFLEEERIPLSFQRKKIAENMMTAHLNVPTATIISEIDITFALEQMELYKKSADPSIRLTPTAFFACAIARAIAKYPLVNSSFEEDAIVIKKNVFLGVAVSIEDFVVVPVIPFAQNLSLLEMALEIHNLAKCVREKKISLEKTAKGTLTLTNFGMAGIQIGIPIIRNKEAAIIGIGAIERKNIFLEEAFSMRSVACMSITFDHRIFDGMYACNFFNEVKNQLNQLTVK